MAFYAHHIGVNHAAFVITSDSAGQTLVPSLTKAYEASGGTIVYKNLLTPGQTSYRTELDAIFALHPDGIFLHTDEATGGTILRDMESLGDLKVPLIDDTLGNSPTVAKSMGLDLASRYLVGTDTSTVAGPASQTYTSVYAQYEGGAKPAPASSIFYDGVTIFALAMVAAKSTNPKVWVNFVTTVSNPPGTTCSDFVGCVSLLTAGKKINYEGVSGSYDFNSHHNVFAGYTASGWNPDGTQKVVLSMSQSDLAAFARS
jgi:branched-chain amino acid transport system substrate-binding protein